MRRLLGGEREGLDGRESFRDRRDVWFAREKHREKLRPTDNKRSLGIIVRTISPCEFDYGYRG